jgi:spoIIIJ-associated protein
LEEVNIAKQFLIELLRRMEMEAEVEGFSKERDIYLEIKGDKDGILIGKHGRTLEALQLLINRMVNKQMKEPVRVVLDIDQYRNRRADSMVKMAGRFAERVKATGKAITIGPFNAHDRRTIHIALKEETSLKTESIGEGTIKKITILPNREEGNNTGSRE